jgi:hypothetical protein
MPEPGSHAGPRIVDHAAIRCAFVGPEGRCTETAGLQYHHRTPFADGGPTTAGNLELRCAAHNAYEAERWFGPVFVRETSGAWGLPTEARSAKVGELGLDQVPVDGECEVVWPGSGQRPFNARLVVGPQHRAPLAVSHCHEWSTFVENALSLPRTPSRPETAHGRGHKITTFTRSQRLIWGSLWSS